MPAVANLVHETSTTTGTGDLTLVNVNGKNNFNDAFGTSGSDVFDYFISNQAAAEWERGTGHMSDASTLVRDTVLESTNSDAAVNFSAGTKDVTNDVPAGNQYYTGSSAGTSVALQSFTANGTYTPASGMAFCIVISTGGGGGGGGAEGTDTTIEIGAGGGGSGATCIELFDAATIGASQTVTIGAAGTAGSSSGGNGGNGGNTTFGSLHTAGGGVGADGIQSNSNGGTEGGAGGTASNGLLNISGGYGSTGIGMSAGNNGFGGNGGAGFWGGGGTGASTSSGAAAGSAGLAYGSGGGGAAVADASAGAAGGAGVAGAVLVIEFVA